MHTNLLTGAVKRGCTVWIFSHGYNLQLCGHDVCI